MYYEKLLPMTVRFFTPIIYASLPPTPFLFAACSAADRNGDEDLVVTIDPEFAIDLYQQRAESDGAATLGLWLESTEPYECAGYRPDVRLETTSDKISVNLLEMILGLQLQEKSQGPVLTLPVN